MQISADLIKNLGCARSSPNETIKCVREASIEKLFATSATIQAEKVRNSKSYLDKWAKLLSWSPRIDGLLFPKEIKLLAESNPSRPFIAGVCQEEVLFFGNQIIKSYN